MLDEEHEGLEQDENEQSLLARAHWRPQCCHCLFASRLDRQQSRRSGSNADEVDYQIGAVWTNGRYRRWCSKYRGGHPARDVVVSQPNQGYSGVIQYDFGKASPSGFHRTGFINSPPSILLSVVSKMRANHLRRKSKLSEHVSPSFVAFRSSHATPLDLMFSSKQRTIMREGQHANRAAQTRR